LKPAYSLHLDSNAIEDLKSLPKNVRNRLRKEIPKRLAADPAGASKALTGLLEGFYSCHIRQHRVAFMIVEKQVWIVAVGEHSKNPGSDIYRRLEELRKRGGIAGKFLSALARLKKLLPEQ